MIELGFIISAFVAGVLTFLAPCTLPLVPAYLGFISGVSPEALKNPETAGQARRTIFKNAVFFVLGFSIVFILFGTLAGFLGTALAPVRVWLGRVGGALVIIFGLFMLGVFSARGGSAFGGKIFSFLQAEHRLKFPSFLKVGRPSSSLAIGSAFAFGWTPCVGPILGSILLFASTSSTALTGGALLAIFSAGLALPMLGLAYGYSRATKFIERSSRWLRWVEIVGGVFLIALGLLLLTDNFSLLIQYGYEILDFINYERLLDYL